MQGQHLLLRQSVAQAVQLEAGFLGQRRAAGQQRPDEQGGEQRHGCPAAPCRLQTADADTRHFV